MNPLDHPRRSPTFVGEVVSVTGAVASVQLHTDVAATLMMVEGETYRVGQVGAFLRIPLGYTSLYAVCTQVGAAAIPQSVRETDAAARRWLTISLFGESVGGHFDRGVSQYPTIGDEVHAVTQRDLEIIYGSSKTREAIVVGHIAASSGIAASLDIGRLVARHTVVVGSTGAGKSNVVAVMLQALATTEYKSARTLIIDPHGEYASAVKNYGRVFAVTPNATAGELPLYVPFWALPFEELRDIALGPFQPATEASLRDELLARKKEAALLLKTPPPIAALTADSPVPFSLRQLWFDLDDFERQTFQENQGKNKMGLVTKGDPEQLRSNEYPKASLGSAAPFLNPRPRHISRQLELLRSRLGDSRFRFLFEPGPDLSPNLKGEIKTDLDALVSSWIGHDQAVTVLDVSGLTGEMLSIVVGTLLRVIYDMLFWAGDLAVGGQQQPLMIVLEEAHLFLPNDGTGPAHRAATRIAKEGRKYGVGLVVVTQRPTEIESTVLSQCGTMIALRLTNSADRERVQATMPDELGQLSALLPALRTGEALVVGEAVPIPSRIRFYRAAGKLEGRDPSVTGWRNQRPDPKLYSQALERWRAHSS